MKGPYSVATRRGDIWCIALPRANWLDRASEKANELARSNPQEVYAVVDAEGVVVFRPDYGASIDQAPHEGRNLGTEALR